MKESELRIGNLVCVDNKNAIYDYVRDIYHDHDGDSELYLMTLKRMMLFSEVRPINLTDEWMETFGFEKHVDLFGKPKNTLPLDYIFTKDGLYIHKYTYPENVDVYEFRFPHTDYGQYNPVRIEYVHQIQNLFFDLKGRELIVMDRITNRII